MEARGAIVGGILARDGGHAGWKIAAHGTSSIRP